MNTSIMIIDDEPKMGKVIERTLKREGWDALAFADPAEALKQFAASPTDIVLSDLKMPEIDGLEMLKRIKELSPSTDFIIMTAYASARTAVDSMRQGACDYLIKPFPMDELKLLVRRLIETRQLRAENVRLREMVQEKFKVANLVAASGPMQEVMARVRKVARSDATVLLRGESGTGKEVLANAIVQNGPRKERPFLKINCGALPESLLESELFGHAKGSFTGAHEERAGLFETADGGTLFLDEIGEVTPALQVKLLRVLQDGEFQRVGDSRTKKVDVRVLAATNRDLEQMLKKGDFRQDLYYRLNVVPIVIPHLRQRRDDIPALLEYFMRRQSQKTGQSPEIDPDAYQALIAYDWPGNIRELENAVEHAMVMNEGDRLELDDLPLALKSAPAWPETGMAVDEAAGEATPDGEPRTLAEIEKGVILSALKRSKYNYTRAAKLLGVTRRALGYRMEKHAITGKLAPPDNADNE